MMSESEIASRTLRGWKAHHLTILLMTKEGDMKTVEIQGMEYKIGLNGKVFVLRNGEWVLSINYTPTEIKQRLEDK